MTQKVKNQLFDVMKERKKIAKSILINRFMDKPHEFDLAIIDLIEESKIYVKLENQIEFVYLQE